MQTVSKELTRKVEKIVVRKFGAPDILQLEHGRLEKRREQDLTVETLVLGVGFVDVMAQRGGYFLAPRRPFSPGYELIGRVIDANGSEAFEPGDLVAGLLPELGAYQTLLAIPPSRLIKLPAGIDLLKSGAAILNYLTASCILNRKARVRSGDTVLIHGASGGVGTALAQLAARKSLKMYGTASAAKHELLRELGVEPIDYRQEDFVKRIKEEHPEGIDAAFDAIGGSNLRRSARIIKRGGVVVSYGLSGNNYGGYLEMIKGILQFAALNIWPDGKRVVSCATPRESVRFPDWYRRTLSEIFQRILAGELDPVVDKVFPFHAAREAHTYLERGDARGKVLLTTPAFENT
jgi:NADPH:quinone reductase-like Zn-dependent oxidoreductase